MRPNSIDECDKGEEVQSAVVTAPAEAPQTPRPRPVNRRSSDLTSRIAETVSITPVQPNVAASHDTGKQQQRSPLRCSSDGVMMPAPSQGPEHRASSSQLSSKTAQPSLDCAPLRPQAAKVPRSAGILPSSSPVAPNSEPPKPKETDFASVDDSGFAEAAEDLSTSQHLDHQEPVPSPSTGSTDAYTDDDSDVDTTMLHSSSEDDQLEGDAEPLKPKPPKKKGRRPRHVWNATDFDVCLRVVKEELAQNPQRLTVARWEAIHARWAQLRGLKAGKAPSLSQLRLRLGGLRAAGDPRFKVIKEEAKARKEGRPYDPDKRKAALLAETSPVARQTSSQILPPVDIAAAPAASNSSTAHKHNFLCSWTYEEERLLLELFSRPEAINQRSMTASVAFVYTEWSKRVDGVTFHARSSSALGERLRNIARREGSDLDREAFELWKRLPCGTTGKAASQAAVLGPSPEPLRKADVGPATTSSQSRKRPAPLDISLSPAQPIVRSEAPAFKKHIKTRLTNNSLAAATPDIFGSAAATEAMELEMRGQRLQIDELASELRKMQERVKHAEEALAAQRAAAQAGGGVDLGTHLPLEQRCHALEEAHAKLRQDSMMAWDDMQEVRKEQTSEIEEMAKKVLEPVALLLKSQVEIKNRLEAMEKKMDLLGSPRGTPSSNGAAEGPLKQPQRNGDGRRETEEERQRRKIRERELEWEAARLRHRERQMEHPKTSERNLGVVGPPAQEFYQIEDDMELDAPSRIMTPGLDIDEGPQSGRSSRSQHRDAPRTYRETSSRTPREVSESYFEASTPTYTATTAMTVASRATEQRPSPALHSPRNAVPHGYHQAGQRASGLGERTESSGSSATIRQAHESVAPALPSPSAYRLSNGQHVQQHEAYSASRQPHSPTYQHQRRQQQQQQQPHIQAYPRAEADIRSTSDVGRTEEPTFAKRYSAAAHNGYGGRASHSGASTAYSQPVATSAPTSGAAATPAPAHGYTRSGAQLPPARRRNGW